MSVVSRLSASRIFLTRACQPAKSAAARLAAPAGRSQAVVSQAFLRCAVTQRRTSAFAPSPKPSIGVFHGFHCSAMAYDAEVGENAEAAEPSMPDIKPNSKIYVGNLSWAISDADLKAAFEDYGTIAECEVVMDPMGRSRGFAFVTMGSVDEATAAIDALNNTVLDGRELRVNFHVPRDPNAPRPAPREKRYNRYDNAGFRVYVGNLPWGFDDFDLQDTFEEFGTIIDARVITDKETGRSRGFGFVTMSSDEEVERAILELDGSVCEGRSIKVNKAER